MSIGRVALVGAVHESLDALAAIAAHPDVDLAGVVTLTEAAAAGVSGAVDLAGAAEALGVPVVRVEDVNAAASVQQLRRLEPDLIAVVGWTRLIRDELLLLPPRGVIGFHASLLPRNRGRAPVNWAIIHGETETGNTLMLLDAGVDTGRIVDQRSTPIHPDDTCGSVYERVARLGAEMLTDNLVPLLTGTAVPRAQDDGEATVLGKRVPAMGVTDWRRSPGEVHDWIRAQTHPYPGAFTHLDGRRVMLWRSEPPSPSDQHGPPGRLLEVGSGLRVATGTGSLVVTRVGSEDGSDVAAADWAAAAGVQPGASFELPSEAWAAWALGQGPRPDEARP